MPFPIDAWAGALEIGAAMQQQLPFEIVRAGPGAAGQTHFLLLLVMQPRDCPI